MSGDTRGEDRRAGSARGISMGACLGFSLFPFLKHPPRTAGFLAQHLRFIYFRYGVLGGGSCQQHSPGGKAERDLSQGNGSGELLGTLLLCSPSAEPGQAVGSAPLLQRELGRTAVNNNFSRRCLWV